MANGSSNVGQKIAIGIIGAGVVGFVAYKAVGLSNFGKSIQVNNDIKVIQPKLSLSGISMTMKVTPTVSNPTNQSVRITQPYVELAVAPTFKDLVGYSAPTNKVFTIPALGVITFDPIVIPVNIGLSHFKALLNDFMSTKSLSVYIKTKVFLQALGSKVPIETVEPKTVKF